jgi:hypothetical protein
LPGEKHTSLFVQGVIDVEEVLKDGHLLNVVGVVVAFVQSIGQF